MANLTPDGFAGDYFRAHTSVLPPPPGLRSPLDWGQEENVRALFGDFVSSVTFARRTIGLRFPSPASAVSKLFASCYGPTVKALDELDPAGARHLRSEISRLFHRHNEAKDGTTAVSVEFLEVQARVA